MGCQKIFGGQKTTGVRTAAPPPMKIMVKDPNPHFQGRIHICIFLKDMIRIKWGNKFSR